MTSEEKLQYYTHLSYPIEIVEEEDAIVASIPDLPGCQTFGKNVDEALRSLKETKELWLKGQIDSGRSIPIPSTAEEFSGKFVLRIPRVLHRALHREAQRQGVSLNQYVGFLLAERHSISSLFDTLEVPASLRATSDTSDARSPRRGLVHMHTGLDPRCRDVAGEIRHKRSDTLVRTLRKQYGEDFAKGFRGDAKLASVLERSGAESLSEYLKKKS
jgi:antitoxin HicB